MALCPCAFVRTAFCNDNDVEQQQQQQKKKDDEEEEEVEEEEEDDGDDDEKDDENDNSSIAILPRTYTFTILYSTVRSPCLFIDDVVPDLDTKRKIVRCVSVYIKKNKIRTF